MSWSEFFAMGGYGAYVWSAYGVTLVVLALNVWFPWRKHKILRKNLRRGRSG